MRAWLCCVSFLFTMASGEAGAQEHHDASGVARELHSEGGFPTTLRRKVVSGDALETPQFLKDALESAARTVGESAAMSAPVVRVLLVTLGAILLVLTLFGLLRRWQSRSPEVLTSELANSRTARTQAVPRFEERRNTSPLTQLIHQEQWGDAVAFLLQLIFERAGLHASGEHQGLTPREVARDMAEPTLTRAVQLAEVVRFAGQPANRHTVEQMQHLYRTLPVARDESEAQLSGGGENVS